MAAQAAGKIGAGGVVRSDHTPFPGGHRLGGIEGKRAPVGQAAGRLSVQRRSGCVGGILDQEQLPLPADPADILQVRSDQPGDMHQHHPAGVGGEFAENLLRIQTQRLRGDIRQHRGAPGKDHRVAAGEEGVGGYDHLAAFHLKVAQQDLQSAGAGVGGNGMGGAGITGKRLLEPRDPGALG